MNSTARNAMFSRLIYLACMVLLTTILSTSVAEEARDWMAAIKREPPTGGESRDLMRKWTEYVVAHHVKRDEKSPQRGMVYEYFDVKKKGQFDQFVQGEQLDTMHDGAWLIAALCEAYRVN